MISSIRRVAAACLCGLTLVLAGADNGIPPDVQGIMDRARAGSVPTPEERHRLTDWAQKMRKGSPSPESKTAPSVEQIPVDVVGTVSYRRSQGQAGSSPSKNENASYTFTAPAVMMVQANDGAGDWWTAQLGATHPGAAHFILHPDPAREGSFAWTGTGETQSSPALSAKWKGYLHSTASIILDLSTTGHGDEILLGGRLSPLLVNEADTALDVDTTFKDSGYEGSNATSHTESKHLKGNLNSEAGPAPPEEIQPWYMESLNPPRHGQPGPGAALPLSYKKLTEIIASGEPGKLMGDEDFSFQTPEGEVVAGHGHVELRLRPPARKLVLTVKPVDAAAYQAWIPKPYTEDARVMNLFGVGKNDPAAGVSFAFEVSGTTPTDELTPADKSILHFAIENVSLNKGLCGNFPKKAAAAPGLKLMAAPGFPEVDIAADGQTASTRDEVVGFQIRVVSLETGAYGHVTATSDKLKLRVTDKATSKTYISLPFDENENDIADKWEEDVHTLGRHHTANWDFDATPAGLASEGDGLTDYEEYRGFIVIAEDPLTPDPNGHGKAKFIRLSPLVRDLFVFPMVGLDRATFVAGARAFATLTKIAVHLVPGEDYIDVDENSDSSSGGFYGNRINFNSTVADTKHFHEPQYAVRIVNEEPPATNQGEDPPQARTWPLKKYHDQVPQSPSQVSRIAIFRNNVTADILHYANIEFSPEKTPVTMAYLAFFELDPLVLSARVKANLESLVQKTIAFTILHELHHALGAHHHFESQHERWWSGAPYCPMRYWTHDTAFVVPFYAGEFDPSFASWDPSVTMVNGKVSYAGAKPAQMGSPAPYVTCQLCWASMRLH